MEHFAQIDHNQLTLNPNLLILEYATGPGDYTKFNILGRGPLWNITNGTHILRLATGILCSNNTKMCNTCNVANTDVHQLLFCMANNTPNLKNARIKFFKCARELRNETKFLAKPNKMPWLASVRDAEPTRHYLIMR